MAFAYEKDTGKKLEFITVDGKLTTQKESGFTNVLHITFTNTDELYINWLNELYKAIKDV